MAEYHSFSEEAVSKALETARRPFEGADMRSMTEISSSQNPNLRVLAECISVTSGNREVCLNLPLGLGNVCIPLPIDLPDGTAAQVCLHICTTWGIPTGVKVEISVGGMKVVEQSFGWGC